jgi:addiction module HigA family antidote
MTNDSLPVEAPMRNPPHPGRIVRQDCIEALGLTIGQAAEALGVTRQTLDRLVNERGGVSPEMALRLARAIRVHDTLLTAPGRGLGSGLFGVTPAHFPGHATGPSGRLEWTRARSTAENVENTECPSGPRGRIRIIPPMSVEPCHLRASTIARPSAPASC